MSKKEHKLISRLIRFEEKTILDIKNLKDKLYKDEYVSFSSLVRHLVRVGLDNYKKENNE